MTPKRPPAKGYEYAGYEITPPPAAFSVPEPDRKPVLYKPDGTPLVRRPAGFMTTGDK